MTTTKFPAWEVVACWWDRQTPEQRRAAMDHYLDALAAEGTQPRSRHWQVNDVFWLHQNTAEIRNRYSAATILLDIRACAAMHIDFNHDAQAEQTLAKRLHDYNVFKRTNSPTVRALNADGRPGSVGEARLWHVFAHAWDMGARASQQTGKS
jgi:limonene-1,2-epoxide hydrolase